MSNDSCVVATGRRIMPRMLLAMAGRRGTLPKKDFLYDRKGPWPQPSPTEPLGTSAEVLHLPLSETLDWQWHIGLRYFRDLFLTGPASAIRALGFRGLPEIDDAAMASALTRGIYSRFLAPLDPIDVTRFTGTYDPTDGALYYKLDFTPIEGVHPYGGMYIAPTITLLRRENADARDFTLRAIEVGEGRGKRVVLQPKDTNAWELAKYYVLQGCSYATLFTMHPNVHFPYDTINAVTKSAIPQKHLLFKILYPHLRFSLVLDNAVLQSKASVISNFDVIYDPFTAKADAGLMSFFIAGHVGIPGNSAYPRYRYPANDDELRVPPTRYGAFLRAYFVPFHEFATAVVAAMSEDELGYAEEWARWIRTWIRTFPELKFRHGDDPTKHASRAKLAYAIAVMLWDVTVVHSTDHQDFAADIPVEWKCFRLREAAPTSTSIGPVDRKKLSTKVDIFKSYLAHRMFFAPTNVTTLMKVDYAFGVPALDQAAAKFRQALRDIDTKRAGTEFPRYVALDQVAASIQY